MNSHFEVYREPARPWSCDEPDANPATAVAAMVSADANMGAPGYGRH
jgi:hypothetical protein